MAPRTSSVSPGLLLASRPVMASLWSGDSGLAAINVFRAPFSEALKFCPFLERRAYTLFVEVGAGDWGGREAVPPGRPETLSTLPPDRGGWPGWGMGPGGGGRGPGPGGGLVLGTRFGRSARLRR